MTQSILSNGEESIVDIVVQQYKTIAALFEVALYNGYGIDDLPPLHVDVEIPEIEVRPVESIAIVIPAIKISSFTADGEQSLADIVSGRYGSFEALFEIAAANNFAIDDLPLLDAVIVFPELNIAPVKTIAIPVVVVVDDTVAAAGDQTPIDLAIQEGGTVEALFDFALLNSMEITGDLIVGQAYKKPALLNRSIAEIFNEIRKPASGYNLEDTITALTPEGIDFWIIEDTFIVS